MNWLLMIALAPGLLDALAGESLGADRSEAQTLVEQLDSFNFADRQKASAQLYDAGQAAFPALIEAVKSDSREVSTRAIEIFRRHLEGGGEQTRKAAREVLESLAKSDHAKAARLAQQSLHPKPPPPAAGPPGVMPVQMQVHHRVNISIKVNNGIKVVEVDENGKKIGIHEEPNNITIEIGGGDNQPKIVEKVMAKNAEELEKNHPDAYRLYKRYAEGNARRGLGLPWVPQPDRTVHPAERLWRLD